ncbi:MAG: hypothetical protein ACOX2M_03880 [Fastidiosipilaceae bacterium]|jgi:hypothetical protein
MKEVKIKKSINNFLDLAIDHLEDIKEVISGGAYIDKSDCYKLANKVDVVTLTMSTINRCLGHLMEIEEQYEEQDQEADDES